MSNSKKADLIYWLKPQLYNITKAQYDILFEHRETTALLSRLKLN